MIHPLIALTIHRRVLPSALPLTELDVSRLTVGHPWFLFFAYSGAIRPCAQTREGQDSGCYAAKLPQPFSREGSSGRAGGRATSPGHRRASSSRHMRLHQGQSGSDSGQGTRDSQLHRVSANLGEYHFDLTYIHAFLLTFTFFLFNLFVSCLSSPSFFFFAVASVLHNSRENERDFRRFVFTVAYVNSGLGSSMSVLRGNRTSRPRLTANEEASQSFLARFTVLLEQGRLDALFLVVFRPFPTILTWIVSSLCYRHAL